jgi:hypothetical protein
MVAVDSLDDGQHIASPGVQRRPGLDVIVYLSLGSVDHTDGG